MSWSLMGVFYSASILSGAVLGAALGLTGFAILHFMGGGALLWPPLRPLAVGV